MSEPDRRAEAATTATSLARGALWSATGYSLPQLYTLAVSILAARFLGPTGMGRQSFIAFAELSLVTLLSSSFSSGLMRYVGETIGGGRPEAVRGLLAWAWRVEAGAGAIGAAILVGAGLAGASPRSAWVLAGVVCCAGVLQTTPTAVLIGLQRWRDATIVGLVTGAAATGLVAVVLALGGGITGLFAVEAVTSTLNLAATGALAHRAVATLPSGRSESRALHGPVLRYAAVASIGVVLSLVVWQRSEFFFLKAYSSDAQIALYSIPFAAMTAATRLLDAVGAVISPAVATLYGAGAFDRIRSGFSRAVRLLVLATLPATAAVVALGPAALRTVYGDSYRGTGPVLLVLTIAFPILPLTNLARALLIGLGRLRFWLWSAAAATAVNLALDVLLVPRLDAIGAAAANSGAQLAAGLPILAYAMRLAGPVSWDFAGACRTAIAAAAAGGAAWAVLSAVGGAAGLLAGVVAFGLTLTALARLLRVLLGDDARWIEDAAGARLGGFVARAARPSSRPS